MIFELWEQETANLIGQYESERDALAFVREVLRDHDTGFIETWELACAGEDQNTVTIAAGLDLAERALGQIRA